MVEELDVNYDGVEMNVGFNPVYLMDRGRRDRCRRGDVRSLDPVKAVVLRGVGRDDYLYLLMPLRLVRGLIERR